MTVVPFASAAAMRMFSVAAHTRELECHRPALQPVREATHVAVLELEGGTERLEPGEVHVDRPRAEVVATGQRDACLAASGEQRPEHTDRRAHALDELVRRFGA